MTLFSTFTNGFLHVAVIAACEESTLVLDVEEEFPCFLSDSYGESLYIIGTACGVDNLVEMALFLEQVLLVACDTLRELIGSLEGCVERSDGDRVDTCECG